MMVSARKVKARLDKSKLAELKKKNTEKQEELSISAEEARMFSDDLVKSAIAGFEKELQKSSPAMKMLAANLSGMIQEFFIGFKQGVDAELNTFVKDTGKTVTKAVGDMNVAVTENVEKVPDALIEPIEELKKEQQETKKEKITKEQKSEMIISDVLKRPTEADGAAKTVLGKKGGVKDWLTRVGLGAIGMEGTAEKIVAQRQQKEAFIQTESKLRANEFEGKSPEETRKILEQQYKVVSETTEKLREVEKEINAYKELGYSEEQAQQLGGEQKAALVDRLVTADSSRLGTPQEKFEKKESSSGLEEATMEQQKQDEEAAKQREHQSTLLSEIRDLLKNQPAGTSTAAPQGGGGFSLPGIPRFKLPSLGGIAKSVGGAARTVGNALKGGWRMANAPLSGIAKVAAPLAAGLSVGEGVMEEAEGKKIEDLGQVVPEGWDKLNPFSWAMRGGRYIGDKLNKGYGAVSKEAGGSGSLGSDIFEGVEKVKSWFGGNPTVENVKKPVPASVPAAQVPASVPAAQVPAPAPEAQFYDTQPASMINVPEDEPQPFELTRTETGSFEPIAIGTLPTQYSVSSENGSFSGEPQSNRTSERISRPRQSRMPDPGGLVSAEIRKVKRNVGGSVDKATKNLPGFARAEIRSRIEKLGDVMSNPRSILSKFTNNSSADFDSQSMGVPQDTVFDDATLSVSDSVPRVFPTGLSEAPADSMAGMAQAIGKNIVVQAPPPVVVPQGGGQQVVSQPFTNNVRNNEPSISDYLRSRYAF